MGNQLIADSKMQYYPTHRKITMQILTILGGNLHLKRYYDEKYKKKNQEIIQEFRLSKGYSIDDYIHKTLSDELTEYILNHEEYYNLYCTNLGNKVVADLFAGEGEWLKIFKNNTLDNNILIGNELEQNRYNRMIEENLLEYSYNLPFEDLQLPKYLIDIMLFNPPYGITNGERNVRRYLKMILERNIINHSGVIVFVVKKDDLLDCSDLITKYCERLIGYKVFDEEYEKFRQVVLIANMRKKPLNLNNICDIGEYNKCLKNNKEFFNTIEEIEFIKEFIGDKTWSIPTNDKYKECFDNFKIINNNKKYYSCIDKLWKDTINNNIITDLSKEKIIIPKQLTGGELSNVIASGKINGEISMEDGSGKHIAVGGVKEVKTQYKTKIENKKGDMEDKTITTITNVPYLNVLINNNGKLEIKELIDNSSKLEEGDEN